MDLSKVKTCELVKELQTREGVKAIIVDPYQEYSVSTKIKDVSDTGPAIILVVID